MIYSREIDHDLYDLREVRTLAICQKTHIHTFRTVCSSVDTSCFFLSVQGPLVSCNDTHYYLVHTVHLPGKIEIINCENDLSDLVRVVEWCQRLSENATRAQQWPPRCTVPVCREVQDEGLPHLRQILYGSLMI